MFRYKIEHLPGEHHFPADMEGLGYKINEKDQIRMIKYPDQPFHYKSSTDEHLVEMRREVMDRQIRHEADHRLESAGLDKITVPLNTPVTDPHVPIFVSKNLDVCERVIFFVGEAKQDLGILSGRIVGTETVAKGTMQKFVESLQNSEKDPVKRHGLVIANPGQLLWHRRAKVALSYRSWHALPRRNAVAPGIVHTKKNYIRGHENATEHIESLLKDIILPMINRGCKVDIIGVDDGALNIIGILDANWATYKMGSNAMVMLTYSPIDLGLTDPNFRDWFGKRARAYVLFSDPFGAPIRGRDTMGCNVYSAHEDHAIESIMPNRYQTFLNYFSMIEHCPEFENEPPRFPDLPEIMGTWGDENTEDNKEELRQEVVQVEENVFAFGGDGVDDGDQGDANDDGDDRVDDNENGQGTEEEQGQSSNITNSHVVPCGVVSDSSHW